MSPKLSDLMSLDNAVFRAYLFYSAVLILKMLLMAPLTARWRYAKKIFISPEDTKLAKGGKSGIQDPDIERVRRAHLNDLENIPIFFVAAFGYLMTNPAPFIAIMLMRLFTLARIAHTIVYAVIVIPQPARAIAWFLGYFITIYMGVISLLTFLV
uniref:Microsomal glutathione S-transferase 1 n=1 Tax=Riptortus pedestris TaxID=329032 RepID=R4WDK0_RIPPE|nr:microsomal glutathione s-transferase [Riptortus pedestris]